MTNGGKRPGAGKPKGYVHAKTLEKQEALRQFQQVMLAEVRPLADALLSAAKGVSHMMAKDRDGTWTEVTDPAIMAKVLNSGETFYRIAARNPDVRALKDIFDRLWGLPTQQVDMHVRGELELVERLQRARQRGKP